MENNVKKFKTKEEAKAMVLDQLAKDFRYAVNKSIQGAMIPVHADFAEDAKIIINNLKDEINGYINPFGKNIKVEIINEPSVNRIMFCVSEENIQCENTQEKVKALAHYTKMARELSKNELGLPTPFSIDDDYRPDIKIVGPGESNMQYTANIMFGLDKAHDSDATVRVSMPKSRDRSGSTHITFPGVQTMIKDNSNKEIEK